MSDNNLESTMRYVLDKGFVRLVDHMGSDLSIVRAARVSHNAAWRAGKDEDRDARLINYLMRNRHTSPFEAVTFTFDVKAPIFIFRQWHRHRTWSFNEISARYTELPDDFYVPRPEHIGTQSTINKQAREIQPSLQDVVQEKERLADLSSLIRTCCSACFITYWKLLEGGVPRELARGVLPVNTYSQMFATVDLHNLFHFLRLRLHAHAQYEIRVYAKAMLELIRPIVPAAVEAFKDAGREATHEAA